MYLAIEIGGTKLQLALGRGDGRIDPTHIVRETVVPERGGDGIRQQIESAIPVLLQRSGIARSALIACGVGFGGPTDDATQSVIKSHHIAGWDDFPLAEWITSLTGLPTTVCNDADVAGLAEAVHGAGKGLSPIFYITVGSGIGGGLIIDGQIYRGIGKGAAEVGHIRPAFPLLDQPHSEILEHYSAGWGIGRRGSDVAGRTMTGAEVAASSDPAMCRVFDEAVQALAEGICTVIKLLCPARIVIGGGVSLSDPNRFFVPLRTYVRERGMTAFAGLTDIVSAALGETVVLHGAIEIAKRKFVKTVDMVATLNRPSNPSTLLSVEEFLEFCARPENDSRRFELVRGMVVEMPSPTQFHGLICGNLTLELKLYARSEKKGYVSSNDSGILVEQSPDTLRGPDVAYFDQNITGDDVSRKYSDVAPLIVFEVLSLDDHPGRIAAKVRDYLAMGVAIVGIVDPEERTLTIYRPNHSLVILNSTDVFDGSPKATGLKFTVADLFRSDEELA